MKQKHYRVYLKSIEYHKVNNKPGSEKLPFGGSCLSDFLCRLPFSHLNLQCHCWDSSWTKRKALGGGRGFNVRENKLKTKNTKDVRGIFPANGNIKSVHMWLKCTKRIPFTSGLLPSNCNDKSVCTAQMHRKESFDARIAPH